ncbi:hypothetical protein [Gluconobacter wancherniae]|uniref:hypothetical protein n=1 Tax=Gluconobacter wancherniae TaxID=1307955 RepID=UPI001B8C7E51|nr:hypothetical protein [Gluconobacter wancherniae]MBS1095937.1 hypothetical protein [Gluconobacter wancherniae]
MDRREKRRICREGHAEEVRGEQTLFELAAKHGMHQVMIAQWKCQTNEGMAAIFSR